MNVIFKIRKFLIFLIGLSILCSCGNPATNNIELNESSTFNNNSDSLPNSFYSASSGVSNLPNSFYSTYSEIGNWIPSCEHNEPFYLFNPEVLEKSEGKLSDVDKMRYLSTLYGNWITTKNNRFILTEVDFGVKESDSLIADSYLEILKNLNNQDNISIKIDENQIYIDQDLCTTAEISIYSIPFLPMETGLIKLDENGKINISHFAYANEGMVKIIVGNKKILVKSGQIFYSVGESPEFVYLIEKEKS